HEQPENAKVSTFDIIAVSIEGMACKSCQQEKPLKKNNVIQEKHAHTLTQEKQ
ncbi:1177_t:CDS:2, partial [Gigaspora rosea]